jgi:uncharacterized protein involved in oxidation of intracellular sulfur
MTSALFVLNDGPYGSERSHNALRHATALVKQEGANVKLFLVADATTCALAGQRPPEGHYSIERMLKGLVAEKALVGL